MSDWLLNLPVFWMALLVFIGTYLFAAAILFVVTRLAVNDRATAFKALSPGMLPPLGILFALLIGFTAAQVWSDFDKAKLSVATEASALRAVVLLSQNLPPEQDARLRALVSQHIDVAVNQEWPSMAHQRADFTALPSHLIDALKTTIAVTAADDGQKMAQQEILRALQTALDARRQRIIVSQSAVSSVKWAGLLLQALCTLIAIAMVHSDNRLTAAIALGLFSTGVAVAILLIASYSRPFTGEVSVGPELLKQVMTTGN
ncbi:MAG TPA: DUF4239 domain-containing protein [Methyloceanibacter sp.]